jgi:hypothetical protein
MALRGSTKLYAVAESGKRKTENVYVDLPGPLKNLRNYVNILAGILKFQKLYI